MGRSIFVYTVSASVSALMCGSSGAWAGTPSDKEGFWEGSSLDGTTKNYYFNRDFRNGGNNGRTSSPNGYRGEWAQGFTMDFHSGYTPGTVGFGVDAYAYAGLKLDSGRGKTGTLLLPINNSGTPQDQYSAAGGAVKMRIGNTVIKYGNMEFRSAPIFFQDGGNGRLLPQTATGWQIISKDLKSLTLEVAHLTAAKSGAQNTNAGVLLSQYGGVEALAVDYAGGTYQTNNLTAALYSLEAENLWRQHYLNFRYSQDLAEGIRNSLNFTLYRTTDTGNARGGEIDNTSWSLANGLNVGSHTFTLSYQQIDGNQPFDYLGYEGKLSTIPFLANISTIHDFNAPHEYSWGMRYDLEFAGYGIPGLSFMARYIIGRDGDGAGLPASSSYARVGFKDDERHWERDLDLRYVVQSGSARNLSIRLVYATTRANSNEPRGDMDEVRVITQYPFKVF